MADDNNLKEPTKSKEQPKSASLMRKKYSERQTHKEKEKPGENARAFSAQKSRFRGDIFFYRSRVGGEPLNWRSTKARSSDIDVKKNKNDQQDENCQNRPESERSKKAADVTPRRREHRPNRFSALAHEKYEKSNDDRSSDIEAKKNDTKDKDENQQIRPKSKQNEKETNTTLWRDHRPTRHSSLEQAKCEKSNDDRIYANHGTRNFKNQTEFQPRTKSEDSGGRDKAKIPTLGLRSSIDRSANKGQNKVEKIKFDKYNSSDIEAKKNETDHKVENRHVRPKSEQSQKERNTTLKRNNRPNRHHSAFENAKCEKSNDDRLHAKHGTGNFKHQREFLPQTVSEDSSGHDTNKISAMGLKGRMDRSYSKGQNRKERATFGKYERFQDVPIHTRRKSHENHKPQSTHIKAMTVEVLQDLMECESDDEMLQTLLQPVSGFMKLLQSKHTLEVEEIESILVLLEKVCKIEGTILRQNQIEILTEVRNSAFLHTQLNQYYLNILKGPMPSRFTPSIKTSISLFGKLLEVQKSSVKDVTIPYATLECMVKTTLKTTDTIFPTEMLIELASIGEQCDEIIKNNNYDTKHIVEFRGKYVVSCDSESPPEDFRSMPVCPTLEDVKSDSKKSYLRPNKVKGRYENLQHYLDVQFRLLREDFLQPLRNGIAEYLMSITQNVYRKRITDVKIYKNVNILKPVCSRNGISHVTKFHFKGMRRIRWENSKRLIFGSLLCLSKDNFKTVYFATVSDSNPSDLYKGLLKIQFSNLDDVVDIDPSDQFVMVETTAYFEAYKYILEGLKGVNKNLPFQKYFVECMDTVTPPNYVNRNRSKPFTISYKDKEGIEQEINVKLLEEDSWPSAKRLGLDIPQLKALQAAFTKEVTVIQGPPGTGKTFIGLKIVHYMLKNKHFWIEKDIRSVISNKKNQILVVCVTNHALDQFLGGIQDITSDKIIRVGGRSKSVKMEQVNLKQCREHMRESRTIPHNIFSARREAGIQKFSIQSLIESNLEDLKYVNSIILNETTLKRHMSEIHYETLDKKYHNSTKMEQWLGLYDTDNNNEHLVVGKNEDELEFTALADNQRGDGLLNMDTEINLIDVEEDAEFERRRRVLDVYDSSDEEFEDSFEYTCDVGNSGTINVNSFSQGSNTGTGIYIDGLPPMRNNTSFVEEMLSSGTGERNMIEISSLLRIDQNVPEYVHDDTKNLHNNNDLGSGKKSEIIITKEIDNDITRNNETANNGHHGQLEVDELEGDNIEIGLNYKDTAFEYLHNTDHQNKLENCQGKNNETWHISKQEVKKRKRDFLSKKDAMTAEEVMLITDISILPYKDRYRLYRFWVNRYVLSETDKIKLLQQQYNQAVREYRYCLDEEDAYVLSKAQVIGMTTTGAAKFRRILGKLQPKIVIVEEAAEALEAHIVTSLNPQCEHLVLIGDHKQLRPNPTVFELAQRFNLNVSLFERLINNGIPCVTLEKQHRMRPEISMFMKHIYPDLTDHKSVAEYESVMGVGKNVFFLNHDIEEDDAEDNLSKSNAHEAMFVAKLCHYLIQQGYQPSEITVLTPYAGQVQQLRKNMPKEIFEGVSVTPVDNFQGEENEIILLSLVRSNRKGNVGFLKEENRVCVALSRAKKGMFVIGNFNRLISGNELWAKIIDTAKRKNMFGEALPLFCQNHPSYKVEVKLAEDFHDVPEGGCTRPCEIRLNCGHACRLLCHPYDINHEIYECMQPCARIVCAEHALECPYLCFQNCELCESLVDKIVPTCNHTQTMKCHENPKMFFCKKEVTVERRCGHSFIKQCGKHCEESGGEPICLKNKEPCVEHGLCNDLVKKVIPKCGHTQDIECHKDPVTFGCQKEVVVLKRCGHVFIKTCGDSKIHKCEQMVTKTTQCKHNSEIKLRCWEHPKCPEICKAQLDCGHFCTGTCGECLGGAIHVPCRKPWKKMLLCGHVSVGKCLNQWNPCAQQCRNFCPHKRCYRKCGDKCIPCRKTCVWKCQHFKCTKMCREPCDRPRCNVPCVKLLNCGHQCTGLCGELCPNVCRKCNWKLFNKISRCRSGNKYKLRLIQLVGCNHIFEVTKFDQYVDEKFSSKELQIIICPLCKNPVKNLRYGKTINSIMMNIETAKSLTIFKMTHNQKMFANSKSQVSIIKNLVTEITVSSDILDVLEKRVAEVYTWVQDREKYFSYQNAIETLKEIEKLMMMLKVCTIRQHIQERTLCITTEKETALQEIETGLQSQQVISKRAKKIISEIPLHAPTHTLKIELNKADSISESYSQIKVYGLLQMYWFKCYNGHVFSSPGQTGLNPLGNECLFCESLGIDAEST